MGVAGAVEGWLNCIDIAPGVEIFVVETFITVLASTFESGIAAVRFVSEPTFKLTLGTAFIFKLITFVALDTTGILLAFDRGRDGVVMVEVEIWDNGMFSDLVVEVEVALV